MIGGHLTPRGRGVVWVVLVILALSLAIALWLLLRPAWPASSAEALVRDNPALSLPAEPDGVVALAEPGGWVRLLADDPDRRLLLDAGWWEAFAEGAEGRSRALVPAAVAAAVLDQFPQGLVVAWWEDGWLVQGRLRGAASLPRERVLGWLPEGMKGRVTVHGDVLRLASSATYSDGWSWRPAAVFEPEAGEKLACWGVVAGARWTGSWRSGTLTVSSGEQGERELPEPSGAVLVFASNGAVALELAGVRVPSSGLFGGVGRQLNEALGRPCFLWVEDVEEGQPLPHARVAVGLPWGESSSEAERKKLVEQVRSALCPFGVTIDRFEDGSERWSSPLVSWWAYAGDWGVVAATGREQLVPAAEGALVAGASLQGAWWVANGPETAAAVAALSKAGLLAELGVVSDLRLRRLRLAAGPLPGFARFSWRLDDREQTLTVELR